MLLLLLLLLQLLLLPLRLLLFFYGLLPLSVRSDLLQVLVQRVDPELVGEGDGLVVDAILSIDTDRPSLKPLYRSALQVRERGGGVRFCCLP